MKKLLSMVLALTLLLALAAPAMAVQNPDARAALDALEAFLANGGLNRVDYYDYYKVERASYIDFNQDGIPELVRRLWVGVDLVIYDVYVAEKTANGYEVSFVENTLGWETDDMDHLINGYTLDVFKPGRFSDGTYGFGKELHSGSEAYKNKYYAFTGKGFVETAKNGFEAIDFPVSRYAMLPMELFDVQRSAQSLIVDGKAVECDKYNINGSNYFKLRDIAILLNGTPAQFSVDWKAELERIVLESGKPYTPVGGELSVGADLSASAVPSGQGINYAFPPYYVYHFGGLSAFNLGGNNYYKLRELGMAMGFTVDYDAATNSAVVGSRRSTLADGEYNAMNTSEYREANGGLYLVVNLYEHKGINPLNENDIWEATGETATIFFPGDVEIADTLTNYNDPPMWSLYDFTYNLYEKPKYEKYGPEFRSEMLAFTITDGEVSQCRLQYHV